MTAIVDDAARPGRTLCLGEALVDLICERPIEDLARADARDAAALFISSNTLVADGGFDPAAAVAALPAAVEASARACERWATLE